MKKLVFFLSLIAFSVNGYCGIKDSIGVEKIDGQFHIKYLVSPGETIYGISTKYGVPISTLMEVNPALENGLKVGQVIMIPYNREVMEKKAALQKKKTNRVVHVVKPGETLYSISKKYGVGIGDLLKWNGMELKAGQNLVVGVTEEGAKEAVSTDQPNDVSDPPAQDLSTRDRVVVHEKFDYDPNLLQVLIIPYDPHLYFSDADDEIAAVSKIHRTQVRQVFRKRLNALLDPEGYETIHLLGGSHSDTLNDLNKIYESVTYNYQEILYSDYVENNLKEVKQKKGTKDWIKNQLNKIKGKSASNPHEKDKGKYFGVKIRDDRFFPYFNQKYSIDYYVFINQFEVITDYEHCLDRATNNFRRYFITHFSIFNKEGEQVAGNKFRVYYNSNSNYVMKIVADAIPQVADRIMAELPPPKTVEEEDQ